MSIAITVADDDSADELRSLRNWLSGEPELHGLVSMVERPQDPHHLGGVLDALSVAVASGGALSVLAGGLIVWLRQRTTDITLHISNGSRHVELQAKRVQNMSISHVQELIGATAEALSSSRIK